MITIQNKLLKLISSPDIKLYSLQERHNLAVIVNSKRIYKQLLPAILAGAEKHITIRAEAVVKRALKSPLSENIETKRVIEVLFDSHFRKQRHKGPSKEEVAKKIILINNSRKPINLVGLMFTRKNICPLRRGGGDESLTDLNEVVSLVHLNSFATLLDKFYPWGVKFTILSEGKRYFKAFDYLPEKATQYQNSLQKWINLLNLEYLSLYDYEDFLREKLSSQQSKIRQNYYNKALKAYQKLMLPILDPMNMDLTLKKAVMLDPKDDPENPERNFVPLWKSILNSLPYPALKAYAREMDEEYDHIYYNMIRDISLPRYNQREENLRQQIIEKSWNAAIEYSAQELGDTKARIDVTRLIDKNGFRTTINAKPGSQLGIYAIRETTSRVQPWHGTGFLETDRSGRLAATALSKLELESISAIPIYINLDNDQPFCYATREAADILTNSNELVFNMSTRL